MDSYNVPFDPELRTIETIVSGKWGIIFTHGESSFIDKGLFFSLPKQLRKINISSVLFNLPFRMMKKKRPDDIETLDQAYLAAWNYVKEKYPKKQWCVGGHDIGAQIAIRVSGLIFEETIPPVIGLSLPMYPPNRPELVNTTALGAIMGDALFCQGDKSKRGTYDRLKNQIRMMAGHTYISKIGGGNHLLEVAGKTSDTVAYLISKEIEKFFKDI